MNQILRFNGLSIKRLQGASAANFFKIAVETGMCVKNCF
jgi:hypothetical protein